MMRISSRLIGAILAVWTLTAAAAASAAPLSADQIERFIASLDDLKTFGERLETEGKTAGSFSDFAPAPGEAFAPYSRGIAHLKSVGEYGALNAIVRRHGFRDGEVWAGVGDRVMAAYMANMMAAENPDMAEMAAAMTPEMMAQMPPSMREQMAAALSVMETVRNAPPEDRAAVAPFMDKLDAWMENQSGGAAAFKRN